MPVIINDFEITVEPPEPHSGAAVAQPAPPPFPPSPEEIAAIVAWRRARAERIHAT